MPYHLPGTDYARHAAGFSFIELIAVMAIISVSVFLLSRPLQDNTDQARIDQTLTTMCEIETALRGSELPGEPALRDVGYIPDMGELPALIDGLPRGLWTPDIDNDGSDDLLRRRQFIDDGHSFEGAVGIDDSTLHTWMGWRGPYISAPRDGVFRDGWGNKLIFKKDHPGPGDLTIVSPGADGIVSGSDTGADSDIKLVIRRSGFTAPVSGVIILSGINEYNPLSDVGLRLYYAAPGPDYAHENITDLAFMEPDTQGQGADITEDGYFLFPEVPVGTDRLLEISQPLPTNPEKKVLTYIRFEVLPTLNWLGRIDIRNSYDSY
jgi:prepilin-type N-terminal cleavage/methylation domain-containing protein